MIAKVKNCGKSYDKSHMSLRPEATGSSAHGCLHQALWSIPKVLDGAAAALHDHLHAGDLAGIDPLSGWPDFQ